MPEETILLAHDPDYWRDPSMVNGRDKRSAAADFPWSAAMVERERVIMQAPSNVPKKAPVLQAAVARNIAGGTHAYADRAEGFCILNDFTLTSNGSSTPKGVNACSSSIAMSTKATAVPSC